MGDDLRVADDAVNSRNGRPVVERSAELRMIRRAVKALSVVLPHQLPVAVFDDRALEGDPGVRDPVGREIGLSQRSEGFEAWRNRRDANKDIAANALATDGF